MIPGTTPAEPDDTGAADPRLAAALRDRDRPGADAGGLVVALLEARLLVPVVALAGEQGREAEMAVPALVAADGRRGLPVFSSYEALRGWRADARPVPMSGARVLAGAAAEGYDGVVLDVAGPVTHAVEGTDLAALAAAARALLADPAARLAVVL